MLCTTLSWKEPWRKSHRPCNWQRPLPIPWQGRITKTGEEKPDYAQTDELSTGVRVEYIVCTASMNVARPRRSPAYLLAMSLQETARGIRMNTRVLTVMNTAILAS